MNHTLLAGNSQKEEAELVVWFLQPAEWKHFVPSSLDLEMGTVKQEHDASSSMNYKGRVFRV